jgi:AcrR family transcriptional regulator
MWIKPTSLYGAFGNKQELFRKALDRYRAQQLRFVDDALQEPTAYAVPERLLRESAVFLTRPDMPPRCMTIQTLAASDEGVEIHKELIMPRRARRKLSGGVWRGQSAKATSQNTPILTVRRASSLRYIKG